MKRLLNKYLFGTFALLGLVSLSSCDKDTEGLTRITYYAELTLDGPTTINMEKGTEFVEPGYYAEMNGEDVSDQVIVTSNINTQKSGIYTVNYVIYNEDGFSSSGSRKVAVVDPQYPIEGIWGTDPNGYRDYKGTLTAYGGSYDISILHNNDGTYSVDDLLGGWYWKRAGYGTNYAMQGTVSMDADNNITLINSYLKGWGDSATDMYNGHYDAATGTLYWEVEYTDVPMIFYVTMYKR